MKKTITSVLSVIIVIAGALMLGAVTAGAVGFAGGDGSEGNPYQVSTPEQLNEVRNYLDAHFIQINDIDMETATVNFEGWLPMGNYGKPFIGTYDGGGFAINKFRISWKPIPQFFLVGLFGVNGGTIKNLGMKDGYISENSSNSEVTIGSIAGYNKGTISNCYNTGVVSASPSLTVMRNTSNAGGIAGRNDGVIENCYNSGDVVSFADRDSYAGGITGSNIGTNSGVGVIKNCYNTGDVFSSSSSTISALRYAAYAGGIAGGNRVPLYGGPIENCYNTGRISASGLISNAYVGGISGEDIYNTSNCYWNIDSDQIRNNIPLENKNKKGVGNESGTTTPLTSEEMKDKNNYKGFDFNTVWRFKSGVNDGYPVLRAFYTKPEILSITPDGSGVTVNIDNTPAGSVLVAAVYDGRGRMLAVKYETIEQNGDIPVPVDIGSGVKIKAMLWDGINTIKPLCEAATIIKDNTGNWKLATGNFN